jgi:hypothetical protein
MPARKPPRKDERPQSEDFIEAARALGGDESREAFERAFAKIAASKPSKEDEISAITQKPRSST